MKRQFISKFMASSVALGAALSSLSPRAEACGGFFCSAQQPVNQAAERIIFADNGDGTVTAVIQILYQGPSQKFSWLLPISTVPQEGQLQVASDLAFTRLQTATNPQFNLTTRVEGTCSSNFGGAVIVDVKPETCDDNPLLAGCANSPPPASVSLDASGVIGQFEWEVISVAGAEPDPATPARDWLTLHGYDVTPESAALIGPYLADGMHLLALKLTKGSDIGSIRPLQLTYAAEAPMIPIKLTAVSANQDMGVMTWALSSARAVPFNYSALELNEARIDWFTGGSNYNQVVTEAADAAGGQGFVTEFAGASARLANVVWPQAEEADWQSVRNDIYQSLGGLFQTLLGRYQSWNGFWDAVRRVVVLPEAVPFEDFQRCPGCYTPEFSPSKLLDAIDADVIEPMRRVQQLIDRAPYVTRLYSTLSAAEMTIDPVFVFNPDLPDVNNVHQAERVLECSRGVFQEQAPWRIELPQGSVVRGTAATVGQWPASAAEQPANLRVLTLSRSGAGRVVDDNADEINTQLAAYNASLTVPDGVSNGAPNPGSESPVRMQGRGGLCALRGAHGKPGAPAPLAVGLLGWVGAVYWRRRHARAEGERA